MLLGILLFAASFFRTLLIIIIVLWIGRIIARFVFPMIMKGMVNKAQKNMQERMQQEQKSQRKKDEVTIEQEEKKRRKTSKDNGEYIDFEEVK